MKPLIFPVATGLLVLAIWVAVTAVDACLLGNTDPKFDCGRSLHIVFVFAAIGAVLTIIAAAVARAVLHRFLRFGSAAPELISAVLSSILLVLLFAGIIYWEITFGSQGGNLLAWLAASFVVSCIALVIVKRLRKAA